MPLAVLASRSSRKPQVQLVPHESGAGGGGRPTKANRDGEGARGWHDADRISPDATPGPNDALRAATYERSCALPLAEASAPWRSSSPGCRSASSAAARAAERRCLCNRSIPQVPARALHAATRSHAGTLGMSPKQSQPWHHPPGERNRPRVQVAPRPLASYTNGTDSRADALLCLTRGNDIAQPASG
jgi:hypothetical protein